MNWFERLTGFRESDYAGTRARLELDGELLRSRVNGACHAVGRLELVSLATLRARAASATPAQGRFGIGIDIGDVGRMHRQPENAAALFQVASQFNLLEMPHPDITPEDGVGGYETDHTQGPACAMAAGAATIYRNYFVPVDGAPGQTAARQLDGLRDLGVALGEGTGLPVDALWQMRNGYALATADGLDAIGRYLDGLAPAQIDALRGLLRVGLHSDVEVTQGTGAAQVLVSQCFCSALPVSYSGLSQDRWQAFAVLVLEAAYEATLWAAVLNARRGASNRVLLTLLGGGAFGNDDGWIYAALRRALRLVRPFALEVRLVSYGSPPPQMLALVQEFQ